MGVKNSSVKFAYNLMSKECMVLLSRNKMSSIVLEGIRTVFFSYQDILHKYKTHKYLNTPKTHNKAHSLGKKYPDNPADKKNNQ